MVFNLTLSARTAATKKETKKYLDFGFDVVPHTMLDGWWYISGKPKIEINTIDQLEELIDCVGDIIISRDYSTGELEIEIYNGYRE